MLGLALNALFGKNAGPNSLRELRDPCHDGQMPRLYGIKFGFLWWPGKHRGEDQAAGRGVFNER